MDEGLSTTGRELRRRLDEAAILRNTVAQLRKDLDLPALVEPPSGDGAFETLRAEVLLAVEGWTANNGAALSRAVNRVDLTERQVDDATGRGGLPELAGVMVLRCLQKVLLRLHFSRGA
ncbi:MAG: hypothetical protein KA791_15960 [Flavobacteriales bacterium]|nr:hypothetical protein [Flavobacteriales bacterium]